MFRQTKFSIPAHRTFTDAMSGDETLCQVTGLAIDDGDDDIPAWLLDLSDLRCFRKHNRAGAAAFNTSAGLPLLDEQKKSRLRSHLSA